METFDRATPAECRLYAAWFRGWAIAILLILSIAFVLLDRFAPNRPVDYASDVDHFYYGSVGSDISGGLPLKVMQVLPVVFRDLLPKGAKRADYTAFGFIQQPDHPMPIGFSVRRQIVDRTALNCGGCHTGSVRKTAESKPMIVAGMPANTVDLLAFFQFLFACANDPRFTAERIIGAMDDAGLTRPLDRLIYGYVVPAMRDALLEQERKLRFLQNPNYTQFGPGRVDTFDTFKFDQFADYYFRHDIEIAPDEIYGIVDFPSVWNQAPRTHLALHWDGNNNSVRERNFSAAIAAGARPEDMDLSRLYRIETWLMTLPAPTYPFPIDEERAARGKQIYDDKCASCHSFAGARIGEVTPLAEIGTDRSRVDSYTVDLLEAQKDYTSGQNWAFSHFRKTDGYANLPLDGIWARAPYLHNGSVPTMRALLSPPAKRPVAFTTGGDVYDQQSMGFVHEALVPESGNGADVIYRRKSGEPYTGNGFVLDTERRGNGRAGHSGPAYGTTLSQADKDALIEYLKTL